MSNNFDDFFDPSQTNTNQVNYQANNQGPYSQFQPQVQQVQNVDPFSNFYPQQQYQQYPQPQIQQVQDFDPFSNNYPQQQFQYPQQIQSYQTDLFQTNPFSPYESQPVSQCNYGDDEQISEQIFVKQDKTTKTPEAGEVEGSIKLSLRLKKQLIRSNSFASQTYPMLVSLVAESLKNSNKAALDLVCVIDHSGSMDGAKMELVKNTFNFLLKYLGESDRLSIVIFDDRASRLVPLLRTTEQNKETILSKINTVYANGGTDINLGMEHAFKILHQRRYQNPVSSIFLLSDGLDTGAQFKIKETLTKYNLEDVVINTFGFGNDHDPQLMNDICEIRDGNFYFIEKLDTIDEAFVDCLGGLLSSVGQNVTIKIMPEQSEVLQGVKIVQAYGEPAMWAKEDDAYITKISTLISGRQKDFVLELSLPPNTKELLDHQKHIKVASAEAYVTLLDSQQIMKRADLVVTLLNEDEEVKEEEDDREVMKNFYRVKGALVMSDARNLADKYKYDEAKKILQNFKEELENSFLKEEQFIKNLIQDILKAIDSVNPKVYADVGKHYMFENARAQMHQKSNLASANCYQNAFQMDMVQNVKAMKFHK